MDPFGSINANNEVFSIVTHLEIFIMYHLNVSMDMGSSLSQIICSVLNSYPSLNREDNAWIYAKSRKSVGCSASY